MDLGQELIRRGQNLLQLAANLSWQTYDDVKVPDKRQEMIKGAIDRMKKAATDVMNAGKKVVQNKGKITAAMRQSFQNLSSVAKDSIAPLRDSLSQAKDSIANAGPALAAAGVSAKDSAVALGAALKEMLETSGFIAKANQRLDVVAKNLWGIAKGLLNAISNIGKSIGDGAKKVAQTSGIWHQGDSE
ncbi:hypothetical protein ElyMa_005093900 [Elysia marginata]|uniref:Uncharacterized protein n=1 Tax=Elysia marginata TaxID=1093978 RepID=A0AAV4JHM5_9GAST|nr:hypothetical protein ElyMa_005093900 [Elysia marginata]